VLKKAATSDWGPVSQGSMRMWKYRRRLLDVWDGGIGSDKSQVVSAFRCVRRGRRVDREAVIESRSV
jgi:hypothetical protein